MSFHEILPALILFFGKTFILFMLILILLVACIAIIASGKVKHKDKLSIKHLNKKYNDDTLMLLTEILSKKELKPIEKEKKKEEKKISQRNKDEKNIFVINFNGDIKANAVASLREEITAILNVARDKDEVVLRLESPGGVVHGYGLATAQLMRLREANIFLTVIIDKVAASGGYMMAVVANKIIAAPFAIIGSIGVIVQLPNFHRLLQDKKIDFEQHTAGEFKRTITIFGENTELGREKLRQEIEDIHALFKQLIISYRPEVNINEVATGEHWYGQQALQLKLIDEIKTSDEYLLDNSKKYQLYEICYAAKKSFMSKFLAQTKHLYEKLNLLLH